MSFFRDLIVPARAWKRPVALLTLSLGSTLAEAAVELTAAATIARTENISRTSHEPTRKSATTYEASVAAAGQRQLAPDWFGQASLEAQTWLEPAFDRNNVSRVGPRVSLRRKFGLGPLAPALSVDAAYVYRAARLGSARGGTFETRARWSQRFEPGVRLEGNLRWLRQEGRTRTFDLEQRQVGLDVTWDFAERWRLAAGGGYLDGRVVTNAAPAVFAQTLAGASGAQVARYYATVPQEVTELYGPGWISYTPEATARSFAASLSHTLNERTALDVRASTARVTNAVGVRYPTRSLSIGVVHSF